MHSVRSVLLGSTILLGFAPVIARANFQLDDNAKVTRLDKIATALSNSDPSSPALMKEAINLCGLSLWTEDRAKTAEPAGNFKLGLAVTDVEIKNYLYMYEQGQSVNLGDLCAGFDVLLKKIDINEPSLPYVTKWLTSGSYHPNPSVRALTAFIVDLGSNHQKGADLFFDEKTMLDPLQALLIIRVVTEEIGNPIRKMKASTDLNTLLRLSPSATTWQQAPEGWSEDAYVAGVTGLLGVVRDKMLEAKSYAEKVSKAYEAAGAASTIAKAIATYTFLKGEITVKEPGQPLVRTKDSSAGEKRTLVAKFTIDGTKVTDWMKDNRQLVALAGLDIDMPKSGALGGVETNWEISEAAKYTDFNNHIVKWAQGQGDVSKVKTNDQGEATVSIEGAAQRTKLDPKEVRPVMKNVWVKVTPQTKSTEIKQDMLDAVTGAIGIKGGPSGFITPVVETLYRMKWNGSISTKLAVKDWVSSKTIVHLTFDIKGSASKYDRSQGYAYHARIDRQIDLDNYLMSVTEPEKPKEMPKISDDMLKYLTAEQIKQMKEAMKQGEEALKKNAQNNRVYTAKGTGDVKLSINDFISETMSECTSSTITTTIFGRDAFSLDDPSKGQGDKPMLQLQQDPTTNDVFVSLGANVKTHFHSVETFSDKKQQKVKDFDNLENLFVRLNFGDAVKKGVFKIPTKMENMGDRTEYHGAATYKFKFGRQNEFEGTAIVSIAITKPLADPKKK